MQNKNKNQGFPNFINPYLIHDITHVYIEMLGTNFVVVHIHSCLIPPRFSKLK